MEALTPTRPTSGEASPFRIRLAAVAGNKYSMSWDLTQPLREFAIIVRETVLRCTSGEDRDRRQASVVDSVR